MAGTIIAFQDFKPFKGYFKSDWVGLKNFIDFLTGPYAWRTIRNTLLINVYDIIFGFPAPIILALLINEIKDGFYKKTVQTISYMPHFISLVVMCGMIVDFSRTDGIFNSILSLFGAEPTHLLTLPSAFRPLFIGSGIWKSMGWGSIIYLATLSSVDQSLYEAAYMDGAGRLKRLYHITFPALVPVLTVQLIMRIGSIMSTGFEKVILLYNPLTYETADVVASYVYRRGLEEMNYSVGAAVGFFNSIINIIILISVNGICKKYIKESLW
jgi:putative aldouronate transport system permease protein